MNVAILYDAMGNAEVEAGVLLAGEPLFSHSLKQFYLHPCIDYLVIVWFEADFESCAIQYIKQWRDAYGVVKPFRQFCCADSLQYVMSKLEQQEEEKTDLYIFHDIRYPCVTSDMIYMVAQKAAMYGLAVTAGSMDENTILTQGNEYIEENFRYVKYPAAMTYDHKLRKKIDRKAEVLELYSGESPYLCNTNEKNPIVFSGDDVGLAEAIVQMRRECRKVWI